MKNLLYIFIVVITGCSTVKKAKSNFEVVPIKNNELILFDGTYKNKCEKCKAEIYSLWSTIDYKSEKIEDWEQMSVRIKVNEDNSLLAELIRDDKIIGTRILDGQIMGDYFHLKRQWKTNFKFIIVWALGDSSVKLALNKEKELVVLRESGGIAFLVAFPVFGADSRLIETTYKRMK